MSTLQNSKGIMSTYAKRSRGDFVRGRGGGGGGVIYNCPHPHSPGNNIEV